MLFSYKKNRFFRVVYKGMRKFLNYLDNTEKKIRLKHSNESLVSKYHKDIYILF